MKQNQTKLIKPLSVHSNRITVLWLGEKNKHIQTQYPFWVPSDTIWQVVLLPRWSNQTALCMSVSVGREHLMMAWNAFSDMRYGALRLCQWAGFLTPKIKETGMCCSSYDGLLALRSLQHIQNCKNLITKKHLVNKHCAFTLMVHLFKELCEEINAWIWLVQDTSISQCLFNISHQSLADLKVSARGVRFLTQSKEAEFLYHWQAWASFAFFIRTIAAIL